MGNNIKAHTYTYLRLSLIVRHCGENWQLSTKPVLLLWSSDNCGAAQGGQLQHIPQLFPVVTRLSSCQWHVCTHTVCHCQVWAVKTVGLPSLLSRPLLQPRTWNGAQYRQGQCMVVTHGFTLGKTLGRWAHLWSRATTRLDGHLRTATWKGTKHLSFLSHFCLGVPLLQELSFTFKWNVSSRYGVPSMPSTKPLVSSFRQYQKLYFTWVTRQLLPTSNTKS